MQQYWTEKDSPRIWRTPQSNFYGDEPLGALEVYTDERLRGIASQSFNAIWLRGRLYDLMESSLFSELNRPLAEQRMENLRTLIDRGRDAGLSVYLFFNEPLALPANDPFWDSHGNLKGEPHHDPIEHADVISLCTSAPPVRDFFGEAVGNLLRDLPGLGGVILITASEHHSHCWSHRARYTLTDGFIKRADSRMICRRCAEREPADIVIELLGTWSKAASELDARPRVLAWNWSWSIWYPEPQAEIIERLPDSVELLVDWERGGSRQMFGRNILIDEYSLGYAGPSTRCLGSLRSAHSRGLTVNAKLQLGTTHELATVPNLPLMNTLFRKLRGLGHHGIEGIMASWNFGCGLTLNSFALGLFCRQAVPNISEDEFLSELAQEYFGPVDTKAVLQAWRTFSEAFKNYPFTIRMLYFSPMNFAPAYPLTSRYLARKMGPDWLEHSPWGDRLEDCYGEFTIDEIVEAYQAAASIWEKGLVEYEQALSSVARANEEHRRHRAEELSCAGMIACHLQCILGIFRFHRWRLRVIESIGLEPPCNVPLDEQALAIIKTQITHAQRALPLAREDARLGFHQEPQLQFYDAKRIQKSINIMRAEADSAFAEV